MMLWQATPANLWQGRDDSAEAPNALRLFQTIARAERFAPQGDARRYRAARLRLRRRRTA